MNKELLTIKFEYYDVPKWDVDDGSTERTITIGIFDTFENDAGLTLKGVYGGLSSTNKFSGSRLALKSRNLAIYAGEQFKDLWIDYLTK